ncbi:ferredoxin [Bacilli bacterium PM5-3]|nr:ferredoxin [Bacilli bacterium PM5-3]
MKRQIIKIDEDKCVGCGLCASACHLSIIGIENGKAKLLNPDVCDGLGMCLPNCPNEAISFIEVDGIKQPEKNDSVKQSGCPGNQVKTLEPKKVSQKNDNVEISSQLAQWPVQIQLVPINAPYFDNANLLVAADCTAFSYGNFHNDMMKNKVTIIGCPKLDTQDYTEKLTKIIKDNNIKSVTIARMEVPCCGGLENAVKNALIQSEKMIPWNVITISTTGEILDV